jgi:hypothetical protein
VQRTGGEAQCRGEAGIEGRQLQLLEEGQDEGGVAQQNQTHDPSCPGTEVQTCRRKPFLGRKGDLTEKHRVGVQMYLACVSSDKDHRNAKEEWKHEADGSILGHEAGAIEQLH